MNFRSVTTTRFKIFQQQLGQIDWSYQTKAYTSLSLAELKPFSVAVCNVLEICFCHTRDTRLGFCSFPPIRTQAFDNLRESNQSACSDINAWQRSKEVSRPEKTPEIENHGYHCVMIFNSSFGQQNSKQQFLSGDFSYVTILFNTKSLYKTKNVKSNREFYLRDGRHASPWLQRTPAALVFLFCIPRTIQIRRISMCVSGSKR